MNSLLEQFLTEARDALEGIGDKLMQLEHAPDELVLDESDQAVADKVGQPGQGAVDPGVVVPGHLQFVDQAS